MTDRQQTSPWGLCAFDDECLWDSEMTTFFKTGFIKMADQQMSDKIPDLDEIERILVDIIEQNYHGLDVIHLAKIARERLQRFRELDMLKALESCTTVMARNIYPKPDMPAGHPYTILVNALTVINKAKGVRT